MPCGTSGQQRGCGACDGGSGGGGGSCEGAASAGPAQQLCWDSTEPVISPKAVEGLDIMAVKAPTIVRFKDRYQVYASSVAKGGIYGIVYTSFTDWAEAPKATFYPMKKTPGFDTYVAAPQLFYFSPKKFWYLVFQSGPPMSSTSENPTDPGPQA